MPAILLINDTSETYKKIHYEKNQLPQAIHKINQHTNENHSIRIL